MTVLSGGLYKWVKWNIYLCIWSWHSVLFFVINLAQQNKALITLFNGRWPRVTRGKESRYWKQSLQMPITQRWKGFEPVLYEKERKVDPAVASLIPIRGRQGVMMSPVNRFFFLSPDVYSTNNFRMGMHWPLVDNPVTDLLATNYTVGIRKLHNYLNYMVI